MMTSVLAEAYLHHIDPFLIEFPKSWPIPGIRWYGVAYLAGFAAAWLFIRWLGSSGRSPTITPLAAGDLMMWSVLGVLGGGRLGYCLFYEPRLLGFDGIFPYWGFFKIHLGGMSSHGGMIGVIAAVWIFSAKNRLGVLHILDAASVATLPGLFFGRLANFVNSELKGQPIAAAAQAAPPWWSVKYPLDLAETGFEPARLAVVRDRLTGALDLPSGVDDETLLGFTTRAVLEGNQVVIELVQPLMTAYHPSQIYQAATDGPILLGVLIAIWWRPRKPGVVGAWFLIVYAVLRILTELFRQPDVGVEQWLALSRGQVLSVLMIVAGVIGLVCCQRRDVERIGGLGSPHHSA